MLLLSLALAGEVDPETGLEWAEWGEAPELEVIEEAPVLDADSLRIYDERKLEVVDAIGDDGTPTWVVRTGSGAVLDSFTFVRLTGDTEGSELLEKELRNAKRTGIGLAAGGASLVALAAVPVAFIDNAQSKPSQDDFTGRVERDSFDSDEDYEAELDFQRQRFRVAMGEFESAQGFNEDMRWLGLTLVSGGVMTMAVAPFTTRAIVEDRRPVANLYGRDRAQELCDDYNMALQHQLQLRGGPPAELPVLEGEEAWEEARLQWQPVVGPAYVGLNVRF